MEPDLSLYYQEQGTGEPLVLLHGNGEDHTYFRRQIEAFSREYRVIAVDTRGHGRSPRGTAPFTLKQFADDLMALFRRLKLSEAVLLGFSDGANIALLFAIKHPERVKALILNGGNLSPRGVKLRWQVPITAAYVFSLLRARSDPALRRKKELLGLMVKEPRIPAKRLEQLSMPVLVIAGTKDMIRDSHTRKIQRHIPGSVLCVMEGDHFIAAKKSESFNRTVDRFLKNGRPSL